LIAAAVAMSMTVTAFAADYAEDPDYGVPTSQVATGTSGVGKSADEPAALVTADFVQSIVKKDNPTVYVKDTQAELKKSAVAELKKSDKPVTFVASSYSVTIDPTTIKKVKSIDVSMDISANTAESKVSGVTVPENSVVIEPAMSGDFGLSLTVTIPKATLANVDVTKAKVYYISDSGEVTELGALSVAADGSASITISHASQYVIAETAPAAVTASSEASSSESSSSSAESIPNTGSGNTALVWEILIAAGTIAAFALAKKQVKAK